MLKQAADTGREMIAAKHEPMDRDTTGVMLQLILMRDAPLPLDADDENTPFAVRVLLKRFVWAHVPVDNKAVMMLACLSSSPGDCVLYTAVCKAIHDEIKREIKLSDLVDKFPWGFPTMDERHGIWDAQKYDDRPKGDGSDNSLDWPEAWGLPVETEHPEFIDR